MNLNRVLVIIFSGLLIASSELKYRAQVIKEYGDLPAVVVNRGKLSQVFLNIIINAAHAIPEGSVADHWLRVRSGESDGGLFVEISNNGASIPDDVLPRIFDPFFTTKPRDEGTGLGLSISHGIIRDHRGTLAVESEPGQGTELIITLPPVAREGNHVAD